MKSNSLTLSTSWRNGKSLSSRSIPENRQKWVRTKTKSFGGSWICVLIIHVSRDKFSGSRFSLFLSQADIDAEQDIKESYKLYTNLKKEKSQKVGRSIHSLWTIGGQKGNQFWREVDHSRVTTKMSKLLANAVFDEISWISIFANPCFSQLPSQYALTSWFAMGNPSSFPWSWPWSTTSHFLFGYCFVFRKDITIPEATWTCYRTALLWAGRAARVSHVIIVICPCCCRHQDPYSWVRQCGIDAA